MPLPLVDADETTVSVGYWNNGEPVASFAAGELRSYVVDMIGRELPVEPIDSALPSEANDDRPGETGTSGIAEDSTLASAVVLAPDHTGSAAFDTDSYLALAADQLAGNPDDAFVQYADGEAAVLAGTTHRGTLYAVYALLERLGVRFFAPDFEFYGGHHEHVPDCEGVTIPDLDVVEAPAFAYRRKHVECGWSITEETLPALVDWMAKTRHNVLVCPADFSNFGRGDVTWDGFREELTPELVRRGLAVEVGGHGFDSFLLPEEYADDHPEWFVDGCNVFDVTEDDAVETYVANVIAYLEERPEIDIFDAWPPDGADWPASVKEAFDSIPDAYARVVRELDAAVVEAFPERDVTVEAIAYASHLEPPNDAYQYDDSVLVDFAPIGRGYASPIDDPEANDNRRYADLLETWRDAIDGPLVVYEYYRRYAWHSLPVLYPGTIGADVEYYTATGVDGLGMYAEPADWLPFELTHCLVGALSWDADLDVEAWLADYRSARYGVVADTAAEYFDLVERAARARFVPGRGESEDETAMARARDLYHDAQDALADAAECAADGTAPAFLCRRLAANAEYAVADTEISLWELRDKPEKAAEARRRVHELASENALDGVVMDSRWSLWRYDSDFKTIAHGLTDAERELFELYRNGQ